MPAVYSWFVGGQEYWFYSALQNGKVTKSRLWALYPTLWLVNAVLELPGLLLGVYTYYGYQTIPSVWISSLVALRQLHHASRGWICRTCLATTFFEYGVNVYYRHRSYADGMINAGLAWPVWISLGSDWGYFYTYPAALATFTLATFTIWAMTTQLPHSVTSNLECEWKQIYHSKEIC